jgi:hypothetical protein
MTESMRELRLPDDLCRAAEEQFGTRFASLEELLTFVLKELVRDDAARMDAREASIIEQRLRDLGYM